VNVIDEHSCAIELSEVRANFIYDLTGWGTIQLSPTRMEELGDDFARDPAGTGPFRLVEYEPDSHIDYARFDDYWRGATNLDGLRVRIIPEKSVQIIELEAGTADSVYAVDPQDLQRVEDAGMLVETRITPGTQFVSLNVSKGPTRELAVRQAIARAIDRDLILEQVTLGLPEKARAGAPSFSPFYHDSVEMIEYDPDAAAQLLDDAGWAAGGDGIRERDGERLFLNILSTDFADWALFNEIYQEQLRAIGIDSEIETLEWGAYLDNWRENLGEWHLTHHSQGALIASLGVMLASWGPDQFWNINKIRDSDDPELMEVADELQEIYDELLREVDMDVRRDLALRAQTIYQEHQLTVWLWHSPHSLAVNPRLTDFDLSYHGRVLDLHRARIVE
jgi:peptide/nickel transport system substrate-binding protein